jgi:hypothetical protein
LKKKRKCKQALAEIPRKADIHCSSQIGGRLIGEGRVVKPIAGRNKLPVTEISARADLAKLEHEYGAAAADNAEQRGPTMRGFKIAHGTLGKRLRTARARVVRHFEQRHDVLTKRVEVRDLSERAVVKLATERKHLTDIIKMVAYQAERDLVMLLIL